jgi:ABC-type glycerol-3-phosphate transport system substrate-binding protein
MATRKATVGLVALAATTTLLLTSCAGGSPNESSDDGTIDGDITFLTNRTDLERDGTWDRYVEEFNEKYPDVTVEIEAITNYEDDVRTRMSTTDYGDVLLVPDAIGVDQYPDFFEPLGTVSELEADYRFIADKAIDGDVFALAVGGNAFGVLYNKAVWDEAGITELPATPEDFLAALQAIKDNTDAIPYYTNYKDGWPLGGQWMDNVSGTGGNGDVENEMSVDPTPWDEGKPAYIVDGLLYDIVNQGLNEEDPLTTNWEESKPGLATGEIASMVLGSWAVSQFREAAVEAGADPEDIQFMAFPSNIDGTQFSKIGGDRRMGINLNSDNKDAARAWLEFVVNDTDFAAISGMVSPSKAVTELPENLVALTDAGVETFENNPAPEGQEGLLNKVADASQVDVWGNLYRQALIDTARGQAEGDKESFFAGLNEKWSAAVEQLAP